MSRRIKMISASLALLLIGGIASAQLVGQLLKAGGVALVVSKFGKDINSAINKVTKTPENDEQFATKVVTILSGGDGKEIGAAQIMGPRSAVEKVQAVAQIEGKFGPLGLRFRALIPISAKNVKEIRRVPGVGISGLIDIKL